MEEGGSNLQWHSEREGNRAEKGVGPVAAGDVLRPGGVVSASVKEGGGQGGFASK